MLSIDTPDNANMAVEDHHFSCFLGGMGERMPDWGFVSKNAVLSKFGMKLKRHLSKEGSKIGT